MTVPNDHPRPNDYPQPNDYPRPDDHPRLSGSWAASLDRALAVPVGDVLVPTGYVELDRMIGGLGCGTLTLVCGPPGVGTSTLMMDILRHNAFQQNNAVALYCADRVERDIVVQLIAAQARVRWRTVASGPGRLEDAVDWDVAMRWAAEHGDAPLRIEASPRLSVDTVIDDLERLGREGEPPRLVIVDPLPAFSDDPDAPRAVIRAARALKSAAMRLRIPILATAGCDIAGRSPADGDIPGRFAAGGDPDVDHAPVPTPEGAFDALSRIADTVLGIYRPDLHCRHDPRSGEVDLTVHKSRSGPTGEMVLASLLDWGRFAEMMPCWPE